MRGVAQFDLVILYRDQRFVVLDKPPGLPVHAGPSGGRSVEDWFSELSRRKDGPWLVHRLDADTSGCLVIALATHAVDRGASTLCIRQRAQDLLGCRLRCCLGGGRYDFSTLRRVTGASGWRMVVDEQAGQEAITDWRVLGRSVTHTWLEMRPRTGRTHQIRVHCTLLGTPILGDGRYGSRSGNLHLLSRAIHVPLDPVVEATADPPRHMLAALKQCGFHG